LLKAFKPTPIEEIKTISDLELCLDDIQTWMESNRLKMNGDKTELIYFGTAQQLNKCITNSMTVNGIEVISNEVITYLGALLDKLLTFKQHISKKCQVAAYNLYNISKIRKYLEPETCRTLMQSLVTSHLDYANGILANLPDESLKPMERIQSMAAKITLGRSKYDSRTQALKDLHWLPIKQRIHYKICLMVHKCMNNEAPKYLQDLLRKNTKPGFDMLLRNADDLKVPGTNNTLGDRAFSVIGPKWYNELPDDLRNMKNTNTFKKNLKTHLFKVAFPEDGL